MCYNSSYQNTKTSQMLMSFGRFLTNVKVITMATRYYTPEQRLSTFLSKVNKNGSIPQHCPELGQCWEWIGRIEKSSGYGRFRMGDKSRPHTHRALWIMMNGEIPDNLFVLHKCDNRACVNPDHLFLGTNKDNTDDRDRKGRNINYRGEKHGRAKLTYIQINEIRQRYAIGGITQKQLAEEYGVTQGNIGFIIRGVHWK